MVRFHKLAAIGLAVTLSSIGSVYALGLGEVTWKSTLNQPLDAEIAVYDAGNIADKELVVKIASDEEFAKAGIERPYVLTDLVFTPIIKSNGKGIIKVTSTQPIKEPYLDFLVSATWASGQTLREYTLLIDPPAYTPPAVSKPVNKQVKPVERAPQKTLASVEKQPQKKTNPVASSKEGGTVKAFRGSSLWLLAERSRGNVSVQQAMLAIYEANPDAFVDGKMSLLKEGTVLRIPTRDQMRQVSRAEAQSQVLANVSGKAVTQRQVVASKDDQSVKDNQPVQDKLKLAGVSDKDQTDKGSSEQFVIVNLNNQVVQSTEALDASRRKNSELRSRMSDLESRLADMKKLIELKDNQLAMLQDNIKKQQETSKDNSEEKKETDPSEPLLDKEEQKTKQN